MTFTFDEIPFLTTVVGTIFFVFRFSEVFISATNECLFIYYFIPTRRQQYLQMYETVAEWVLFDLRST